MEKSDHVWSEIKIFYVSSICLDRRYINFLIVIGLQIRSSRKSGSGSGVQIQPSRKNLPDLTLKYEPDPDPN